MAASRSIETDIGRPRACCNFLGAWAEGAWSRRGNAPKHATAGHPARGRSFGVAAGLLARSSALNPVFPMRKRISDIGRIQLTAYSCGGSAGFVASECNSPASHLRHQVLRPGGTVTPTSGVLRDAKSSEANVDSGTKDRDCLKYPRKTAKVFFRRARKSGRESGQRIAPTEICFRDSRRSAAHSPGARSQCRRSGKLSL